jgi:hypothetical protein
MVHICSETIAGWLWYCDVHDAHGMGDTEGEGYAGADSHQMHSAGPDGLACDIVVWLRTPHERLGR